MKTLIAICAVAFAVPAFADESAKDILQKARDQGALSLVGLKAELKLTNIESDGTQKLRELTTQSRKIDGVTKTISRFKSPPDVAGVALLTVAATDGSTDEIALYAPKVRRTRKIAAGSRNEPFMESEFTYADFSGISLDDSDVTRDADARVNGHDCFMLSGAPKDSPYKKVIAAVDKATYVPIEVRYFDDQGLLKVYTVQKIEDRDGKHIATESVMVNQRTHRKTTLSVGQLATADAPDAAFTDRGLERG